MASTSANFLSNTGASILPGSLVSIEATHVSFTGELEEQMPEWNITLPGTQTWEATKYPGTAFATSVDVTQDLKAWIAPVLVEQAGTLAATVTGRDGDGTIAVSPEGDVTVSAESSYTNHFWIDVDGAATSGIILVDSFTDTNSVDLAAHEPDTNTWIKSWELVGTWDIQSNRANPLTGIGSGYSLAMFDAHSTSYDISVNIRFPTGTTTNREIAGLIFRGDGGTTDWIAAGIDQIDATNRVRIEKRVLGVKTSLASTTFAAPTADTDYQVFIRNDGDSIKLWLQDASTAIDPDVDTPLLSITDSTFNTNTYVGMGGVVGAGPRGPVLFDEFFFHSRSLPTGADETNAMPDIDVAAAILDRTHDKTLIDIMPGTYAPTRAMNLYGVNVWCRWGTSGTKPVINQAGLPSIDAFFNLGTGASTSRRITVQGFAISDTAIVRGVFDLSDAGVLDLGNDTIVTDSTFYDAVTTGDSCQYHNEIGMEVPGLTPSETDGLMRYYIIKVSSNLIALAASAVDAGTDTRVNMTALSNGAVHALVTNGARSAVTLSSVDVVDFCVADVDIDPSVPTKSMRFFENTMSTGTRGAFIRCNESLYSPYRYGFGLFAVGNMSLISCGSGGSIVERSIRFNGPTGIFGAAYNNIYQNEYSGKNPLRIQDCTKSLVYGNRLVGTSCSTGGDNSNPQHVRFEQNVLNQIDYHKHGTATDSDIFISSNLITDVDARLPTGLKPTGATFSGGFGISDNVVDRARVVHNTLSLEAGHLPYDGGDGNVLNGIDLGDNAVLENNVYAVTGTALAGFAITRPTASLGAANSINNTLPEDSELTGNPPIIARIAGVNVSEATWLADSGSSGDQFTAMTYDANYVPSTKVNVTVPTGVHYDFFGRLVTPGDTVWAGAVMSAAPVVAATGGNRDLRDRSRTR